MLRVDINYGKYGIVQLDNQCIEILKYGKHFAFADCDYPLIEIMLTMAQEVQTLREENKRLKDALDAALRITARAVV